MKLLYILIFSFMLITPSYALLEWDASTACSNPNATTMTHTTILEEEYICYDDRWSSGEFFANSGTCTAEPYIDVYLVEAAGAKGTNGCAWNQTYWKRTKTRQHYGSTCTPPLIDIDGVCSNPPPCTKTHTICKIELNNSNALLGPNCICHDISDEDHDNDGRPNDLDTDFPDFNSLDGDGDTILNGEDNDIDGDSTPNDLDSDPYDSSIGGGGDIGCKGVDKTYTNSLPFPFSEYKFYGFIDEWRCGNLLLDSQYDAVVSLSDINHPYCEQSYCYAHEVKNNCSFDASWYRPATDWVYISGKTESQCDLLVDGVTYSSSSYVVPDSLKCPNTGFCYLRKIDPNEDDLEEDTNSEDEDETMQPQDLNSTSSDLAPLLNAQNTTNKHLQDLKDKTDHNNKRLDDLKDLSEQSLIVNKDIKSGIDGLKSNSDRSLSNQADGLSKLASIYTAVDGASDKIGIMSDVVTGNQVLGNGFLSSIDDKMTINNDLLTNIDSTQTEAKDFIGSLKNSFNGLDDDGNAVDVSDLTSSFDTATGIFDQVTDSITNVSTSYDSMLSSINTGFSASFASGSDVSFSTTALGKDITVDFCPILSSVAPIFYYIFYVSFLIISLRIFYEGFRIM